MNTLLKKYATKLHEANKLFEGVLKENGLTAMYPDHFIDKIKKVLYGE